MEDTFIAESVPCVKIEISSERISILRRYLPRLAPSQPVADAAGKRPF
jgi:hypothetical protein